MRLFSLRFSLKRMHRLSEKLATLTDGSIPIVRALEIIARENRYGVEVGVLKRMADDLRSGATLEQALLVHKRRFPRTFIACLACGERAGKLSMTLRQLADGYWQQLTLLRAFVRQLIYPLCVLIFAIFVLPYLIGVFLTTEDIQTYTMRYCWHVGLQVVPPLLVLVILGQSGLLGKAWRHVASRVWPLSTLVRRFALARACWTMAVLLDSGIPLIESIERAAGASGYPRIERQFIAAARLVEDGVALEEAVGRCVSMPPMAHEMLSVGEYAGRTEAALEKTTEYLYAEAYHALRLLSVVAGIVAILLLGLMTLRRGAGMP